LGWTSVDAHDRAAAESAERRERVLASLEGRRVDEIPARDSAIAMGRRLYLDNCAACHGREAKGNTALGAPGLAGSSWLYGGDPDTVVKSILDGRRGIMPAWGDALGPDGVVDVAAYVHSLSGIDAPPEWVATGKVRFDTM